MVGEVLARCFGVGLSNGKMADDFENKIAAFVAHVSSIQEALKFGFWLEPSVCVPVRLVSDSIMFFAIGRVHDGARHYGTLVFHDEPLGMVNMGPQSAVALS